MSKRLRYYADRLELQAQADDVDRALANRPEWFPPHYHKVAKMMRQEARRPYWRHVTLNVTGSPYVTLVIIAAFWIVFFPQDTTDWYVRCIYTVVFGGLTVWRLRVRKRDHEERREGRRHK